MLFMVVAGFDLVFPMEKLFLFSPTELQMILCGDQSPQWTRDDIINYTEPKLGYTRERSVNVLIIIIIIIPTTIFMVLSS